MRLLSFAARVLLDGSDRVQALSAPGEGEAPDEGEVWETMGVCVFAYERGRGKDRDLAHDLIADHLGLGVFAYRFGETRGRVTPDRFWCDLASIDAYYQANLSLLRPDPPLDLYQPDWIIRTYQGQCPPARTVPGPLSGTEGVFFNSMLAAGTVISGGGVNHSILYPQVKIEDGAIVEDSILFQGVQIGAGAHLRRCIIEKGIAIAPGEQIGLDLKRDRERFLVSPDGVVVVTGDSIGPE
ncbi:hypothetical protein GWK36_14505 [Caldichromatium japonicum]|uniref:Glucose-1-phosphate adenylyltransferase/Bifunctional protein GlmU-like C-terminal hexapeptide domain-containing protein n=1 Tax=Caldichromatium japonicum TaxID=2699430 RepID=A0A6G7VG89_9GAMM|nr:hypothetical protein GWK36_14505 [Caldichromatium japonicum]